MARFSYANLPLPRGWPERVRSAVIHTMSLAAATVAGTRGWAAGHLKPRVRLMADNDRLRQEVELLKAELRLKDARMSRVPGHERPHFMPAERLEILELRAVRGWSLRQAADRLLLSPATLSLWVRRLDERGSCAMVQAAVPLNKYPDYVTYIVQRLRLLCPGLGYVKIGHFLGRAGLQLGKSTIRRMILRPPVPDPSPMQVPKKARRGPIKRVVAQYPHHAWHCDLTTVPTSMGFWTSVFPFSLPPRWPFCWWLVVLADQYSARILRLGTFRRMPNADDVQKVIARALAEEGVRPDNLITDRGLQFRDGDFRGWCKARGIRPLRGAIGQVGSIPFVERLIRTVKSECTRRVLFPYSESAARAELGHFRRWYNGVRPHWRLRGATPDEVHDGVRPYWERRPLDPRIGASRRARGVPIELRLSYVGGRRHLPIVALDRAA